MNCYNHINKPAVAICKNCYKAICGECAIPDDNGFACSEKCHQEIIACAAMNEKAKSLYGLKAGRTPINTIFMIVGGIPFLILGILTLIGDGGAFGIFMVAMGIIFIGLGIVSYRDMKKTGIKS